MKQKIYFSKASNQSQDTIDAWTGGTYYKRLFSVHIFRIKIEFWKKNETR